MTDRELAVQVEYHLRRTTISYPEWVKRKNEGRYKPPDGSGTEWGKAFASLAQIGVVVEPPPPPPPPPQGDRGAKLVLPSVYANPPSAVRNVQPGQISGASDTVFKFAAGPTGTTIYLGGNFTRCVFDLTGVVSRGAHDGVKGDGTFTDCWFKGLDVAAQRNIGFMFNGSMNRVMISSCRFGQNNPNFANGNEQNFHGIYLGSNGRCTNVVIGDNLFDHHNYGYPVHIYDGYGVQGAGLYNSWITGNTFRQCGLGNNPFPSVGVSIIALPGQASSVTVTHNVNDRCNRQLADGPVTLVNPNAEVAQVSGDYSGHGVGGAQPGTDVTAVGDPGYRLPWDTRAQGIGSLLN